MANAFIQLVRDKIRADLLVATPDVLEQYGQDWSGILKPRPLAIAFPRTTHEVAELVRLALTHQIAIVPSGGRTGLSGGACAAQGELVISLEKMNQLGVVDPVSHTLRVGAGAITQAVHEHCKPHGLTWPVDFASKGSSQIGGNLATNAGGVHVIRYGNARQWILSLEVVTPQGEVLELNGELEKNNTGYDLRQLFIGSEGTLGIITAATLKLTPLPKDPQVFFFALNGMEEVTQLLARARRAPFTLSAFEYLSPSCYSNTLKHFGLTPPTREGAGAYALIEVDSGTDLENWLGEILESGLVLDSAWAQSPAESRNMWQIREGTAEAILTRSLVHQHDVSVPIRKLPEFSQQIEAFYRSKFPAFQIFIFGHIGDGNLHIFIRKPEPLAREEFLTQCAAADTGLFELIQSFNGSVSAEHGIGVLKKKALPYSRSPAEIALLRAIKTAFDPQGLMNPGKIL